MDDDLLFFSYLNSACLYHVYNLHIQPCLTLKVYNPGRLIVFNPVLHRVHVCLLQGGMYNSLQGIVYHWSKKGVPDSHQVQLQCCRAGGVVFKLPPGVVAGAVAGGVNMNYGYGSGSGSFLF